MSKFPGAKHSVAFGAADKPLLDWRKNKAVVDEADPDDEEIETPEDVKALLGFDPKDESDDDMSTTTMTDKPKTGLRDALLRRKRAAKNASQLAMFSPSPCISKYAAGKRQAVAKNAGTSEGVRKALETRHGYTSKDRTLHHVLSKYANDEGTIQAGDMQKIAPHHRPELHTTMHISHAFHALTGKEYDPDSFNSGTSAGVRKSWLSRQGAMTSAEADAAERQAVLRGRLIRHLNKTKHPKPMPTPKAG